jgi:hypothetical protein
MRATIALVVLALAAAAPAAAAPIAPCKLVTAADARATLGGAVGPPKVQTLGLYKSCTYAHGAAVLTVQTRALSRADFVKSAKANPPPVVAVSGLGVLAYSAAGFTLLVWRNGTEATFTVIGGKGVAAEKALAKRVAGRL